MSNIFRESQIFRTTVDGYPDFDLEEVDESECFAEFRFRKRDIVALFDVLQIPAIIECD